MKNEARNKLIVFSVFLVLFISFFSISFVSASDGKCSTLFCYIGDFFSGIFSSMTGKAVVGIQETPQCGTGSTAGIVGYWDADGDADDVLEGNSGTLVNGVTFTAGRNGYGQAFSFNGGNYVQLSDAGMPMGNSPRTTELWLKTTQGGENFAFSYGTHSGLGTDWHLGMKYNNYNVMTGGGAQIGNSVVNNGNWHHLVAVYDGTTLKGYVDGVEQSLSTENNFFCGVGATVLCTVSNSQASIGRGSYNGGYIAGAVDEVAVYNRTLSSLEIQQHYAASNAGQPYCEATAPTQVCGNNILESPEVCDGTDLNSQTCSDIVPGTTGTLTCNAQCSDFITTQCTPVDTDTDTIPDSTDNCVNEINPDQLNKDNQDGGDVCDVCPEDVNDSCNQQKSGGEYIPQSGGDVTNQDNSLTVTVPASATSGSSFAMQEAAGTDLTVKTGAVQLAAFNVEPSGAVFNQPVTLSAVVSTTALTQKQINSITFYMRRDDGTWTSYPTSRAEILGDGIGDNDGICEPNERCIAQTSVTHFSVYAIGYLEELPECTLEQRLDLDGNGIVNINDAIHIMRYLTGQSEAISESKGCELVYVRAD